MTKIRHKIPERRIYINTGFIYTKHQSPKKINNYCNCIAIEPQTNSTRQTIKKQSTKKLIINIIKTQHK